MVKKTNFSKSFGSYVKKLGQKKIYGRENFKKIGVAASYLNDIEKDKRTAPQK